MEEEKKDIVTSAGGPLTNLGALPEGFEEPIDVKDIIISRATLLQALSPDVVAHGNVFRPGQIIDSVTKIILPEVFIPLYKFTNYIRFNPRNKTHPDYDPVYQPGEIIWRSTNPLDPRVIEETKFREDGSAPLATKFLNYMSYFPGVEMPVVVSFSKTSYEAGKNLLNLALRTKKAMFATKYKLSSAPQVNDAGQSYFVLQVDSLGPVTEEELILCKKLKDAYAINTVKVHEEAPAGEEGEGK
jgi:hypothetical protein